MKKVPIAVYGALGANLAIAATKFLASAATGSSAMFSEGIHSLVDTGNQGLLLLGIHRSRRPPDDEHPFGHGKELYFWGLVVAIVLFGIGGGLSVYEGVVHVQQPVRLESPTWNYIVIAVSFLFESISFSIALFKEFLPKKGKRPFLRAIRKSKDPSVFVVMFEDASDIIGLAIAALGVYLSHRLQMPVLDGVASLAIGGVLAVVAIYLAHQSKGLLLGESVDKHVLQDIRLIAERDPAVAGVGRVLTMHLGPEEVLLNIEVQFRDEVPAHEVPAAIQRLEKAIRHTDPSIRLIFVEASALTNRKDPAQR